MTKAILFDFSRVLLNSKDPKYGDSLNALHKRLSQSPDYNPLDHFEFNKVLLDYAQELKNKYPLYVFTTGTIQEDVKFSSIVNSTFERVFTVEEVGYGKDDKNAYLVISKLLNLKPEEIFFVDDMEENVKAASEAGLNAVHFKDNEQIINAFGLL